MGTAKLPLYNHRSLTLTWNHFFLYSHNDQKNIGLLEHSCVGICLVSIILFVKVCVKSLTDVASKCHFCLRFAHYRYIRRRFEKQLYILQRLTYPVLAMMHLRWFTCDYLLAMATRNCTIMYELSLEGLWNLENNRESHLKIG